MNTDHLKKLAIDATPGPWREVTTLENGFFEVIGDSKRVAHAFGNCRQEAIDNRRYIAAANPAVVLELIAEVERLRDEIDLERLRLSACGVVAMQNTVDSRKDRIGRGHSCYSASYAEVCRAVDAEINLRQQRDELLAALRVFTGKYNAAPDGPLGIGLTNGDFFKAMEAIAKVEEL